MAPCLSKMPSVCLETIFKYVPLAELLRTVGMVCSTWYASRRTALMRRRRLFIVENEQELENALKHHLLSYCFQPDLMQHVRRDDGSPWLSLETREQVKFDLLVVAGNKLTTSSTSSLIFMTHITQLTLLLKEVSNSTLTQVILIIEHLSEHLIDLKVALGFNRASFLKKDDEDVLDPNLTKLFDTFRRLPSLRNLGLDFVGLARHLTQLAFLPRLVTFCILIESYENLRNGWLLTALRPYASTIDSIKLYNVIDWDEFVQIQPQEAIKFSILGLWTPLRNEYDIMRQFCTRFNSLTSLGIGTPYEVRNNMPMSMMARCLSQLAQLVHLDLTMNDIPQLEVLHDEDGEALQPVIAQVNSVRLLDLFFHTKSHLDTERLFIPEIFPNVQVLAIKHNWNKCSNCPTFADCARLSRQPFRQCSNLTTVALVDDDDNITKIPLNEL